MDEPVSDQDQLQRQFDHSSMRFSNLQLQIKDLTEQISTLEKNLKIMFEKEKILQDLNRDVSRVLDAQKFVSTNGEKCKEEASKVTVSFFVF